MIAAIPRLILIAVLAGALTGCTAGAEDSSIEANTITEQVLPQESVTIPFTILKYTKTAAEFIWEWSGSKTGNGKDEVPQEVEASYKEYEHAAPGGFIVKETATDYYICVSVGGKTSADEGFTVQSLSWHEGEQEENTYLSIGVMPRKDDLGYTGEITATSLIRVAKQDLPDKAEIGSISMVALPDESFSVTESVPFSLMPRD